MDQASSSRTDVNLLVDKPSEISCNPNGRKPKRVLHFSDGTLEEYSSDEEGVQKVSLDSPLVNPATLPWLPWMAHQATSAGIKALSVCDHVGESLAYFLGITGPKYRYEIEEAQRMQEEEMAEKKILDVEMAGWGNSAAPSRNQERNDNNQLPEMNSPASISAGGTHPSTDAIRY